MNEQIPIAAELTGATQAPTRRLRVLFLMRHFMYLRNYESTLRLLASRGHDVVLGYEEMHTKVSDDIAGLARSLAAELPNVDVRQMPVRRDTWASLASQMRSLRNYCRYLTPRFQRAVKCAERAESHLMPQLRKWANRRAIRQGWAERVAGWLAWLEYAIPLDRRVVSAVRSVAPDVVVVTPLVDLHSTQVEYVKAARALGVPSVHCVASWDNLTNKGLVLVPPDTMLVWNEAQKSEAVELHGMAPDRVNVTGAQLFDDWFDRKPSRDRTTFCRQVGLDPERPIVLYTCSSVFIARYESEFFRRWLRALRSAADERLSRAGVLIRPHPGSSKHAAQWDHAEIAGAENVTVFPRVGGYPVTDAARADYFDSIYHCAAVVGINTSAMLEAGIVGRQCFTVLDPDVAESQEGMLHFGHLTAGNFLMTAQGFEQHIAQLGQAVGGANAGAGQRERFIAEFLRPLGRGRPATPVVAGIIEQTAQRKAEPLPAVPRLCTAPLFPLALYLHRAVGERTTKKWDKVSPVSRAARRWRELRQWAWRYGAHLPARAVGRSARRNWRTVRASAVAGIRLSRRICSAAARGIGSRA
jgi:hypothetical protein